MADHKLAQVAQKIATLLEQKTDLRQTEIARALGEHDSTVLRALPRLEQMGIRLAEDDRGRLSLAETPRR